MYYLHCQVLFGRVLGWWELLCRDGMVGVTVSGGQGYCVRGGGLLCRGGQGYCVRVVGVTVSG